MNSAIDRLAAQLMKLSDDDWAHARKRWAAGLGWDEVFGDAWNEISERLAAIDMRELQTLDDGDSEPVSLAVSAQVAGTLACLGAANPE